MKLSHLLIALVGAAYEQEGHLPYHPFIEAFDRYLAEQQRPPEQNPITYYKPMGASDLQKENSALFKATASFLTSLTTDGPVVLLLDDLHAADEASLSLFHYLARQTRLAPIILLATYHLYGDKEHDDFKVIVDTTLQQARRMGAPRAIALCQSFNGALEFQVGHWSEAKEALRESIQLFRQIGAADGEALSCQRLGILQSARGQLDEALSTLEDGVVAAKHAKLRAHIQGRLYAAIARNRLLAGDLSAAEQALSLGQALTESHGHCPLCEALLLPVAVSVRIAQGDLAAAGEYCRQLDEATTRYGSHTWVALAAQAQGELAAARGDIEAASAYYTEAQAGFREARNEYAAAQCLEALTQLQ